MTDNLKREQYDTNPDSIFRRDTSVDTASHQDSTQYLDKTQQTLLLAALNSQIPRQQSPIEQHERSNASPLFTTKPPRADIFSKMDALDNDFTPELLDFDDNFDFDNADLDGQMIGDYLDHEEDGAAEYHEKRKDHPDDDDAEGGDVKRHETGGDRGAKKPGRKPLMSEPTTKRKAQNRAAQRAFRERKEAHLKDLETKVFDMIKSSEADKHENGLLRAQVDRLQVELRDYRKRLSLNGSTARRSPPLSATRPSTHNQSFQFEFPKFGSLSAAEILSGASNEITPPLSNHSPVSTSFNSQPSQLSRHDSEGRSLSPTTQNPTNARNTSRVSSVAPAFTGSFLPYSTSDNMHGFASTLPQMGKNGNDPFGDLFSPSILKSVSAQDGGYFKQPEIASIKPQTSTSHGGDNTAGIPDNRVFRFNSTSAESDSASPSMSLFSQGHTANSSCGTSPEPINDSPATKNKPLETTNIEPQFSFTQLPTLTNDLNFTGLDNFNVPQLDSFDPVLFGDYRSVNDNVVGSGDFNGGFFDDPINSSLDWNSPSNLFGILSPSAQANTAPTPSHNLMAACDKARDGGDDDYGLPGTQKSTQPAASNLISCTKIWDQLQSNPVFQDGKFDLDGLCAELRTKARCSESGLVVESDHVESALKKLVQKSPHPHPPPSFMFEQESWDDILNKLNAGRQ